MSRVFSGSLLVACSLLFAVACGDDRPDDAGVRPPDASLADTGVPRARDAALMDSVSMDVVAPDAEALDATAPDAEVQDAEALDAEAQDAVGGDAQPIDAQPFDAQPIDAQPIDAEPFDAQPFDAQPIDAQPFDAQPIDAFAPDAVEPDASDAEVPDALELDAGGADTGGGDTGAPDAGGSFTQGGGVVITELAVRTASEWIEVHNTTTVSTIALETYTLAIDSHAVGPLPIHAASDPTGTLGTPVLLGPNAYAVGVPNPTNAADIPANTTFVIGAPGQLGADAFADSGDLVTLASPTGTGDLLDFRTAVTDAATPIGAADFPLAPNATLALDPPSDTGGGELANDNGGVWCADVFRGATRGAANRSCNAFVISELSYDYDSFTTGVDDGQEFVELAGPAGGSLADLILARVEGTGAPAGTIDGEIAISGGRMPLDGLFVIADDNPLGGPTQVPNADQVTNLVMENGPDSLQLVRLGAAPLLLDAIAYGIVTALTDTTRGFAIVEGQAAPDPSPTVYTIDLSRRDDETDSNNNLSDFRHDPSPTPGERNGQADFALSAIAPNDASAGPGRTVTVLLTGADFTDQMTVSFAQTPAPPVTCTATAPNTLMCTVTYPAAGSGLAEHVDVTLNARLEHGGSSTLIGGFTWTTANNETNVGAECDFCNLQFPSTLVLAAGSISPAIYGQIYEAGLTDVTIGGPAPGIIAEVGYGPSGSDPRAVDWSWFATSFNVETGPSNNNDEYLGTFVAPSTPGTYGYAYRYSLDFGLTWSYADTDGAGSNGGLTFDPVNAGVMTVN